MISPPDCFQPFKLGHFPLAVGDERTELRGSALAHSEPLRVSSALKNVKNSLTILNIMLFESALSLA